MTSTCHNIDDHIVPDQFSGVKRSRDNSFSSVFSEDEHFYIKRAKHEDVFSFDPPSSADSGIAIDLYADTTSQLQQTTKNFDFLCNLEALANGAMNADSSSHAGLYDAPFTSQHCQAPLVGLKLIVLEQPEEYYRARYESEGYRGPLKGQHESYPSVQVLGNEFKYGTVDVKLVHEDGSDHTSCSLDDTSEERKNALSKKIGPHNQMTAEFEDLRIRREKKKESGRKQVEKSAYKEGHSDKVACLLYTAIVQTERGHLVLTAQSNPIHLTTAPEAAELHWIKPSRGHFTGQEEVVIKGSKMTSPKVIFYITVNGHKMELHGMVDKEKSHQNVLLVKTPSLPPNLVVQQHKILAQVVVTTGRAHMPSHPLPFEYIPDHVCHECMQTVHHSTPLPHTQLRTPPPTRSPPSPSPPVYSPVPVVSQSQSNQTGFTIQHPCIPHLPSMPVPIKAPVAQLPISQFPSVSDPPNIAHFMSMPQPTCIGSSTPSISSTLTTKPNQIMYPATTQQPMSQASSKEDDMLMTSLLMESASPSDMTYKHGCPLPVQEEPSVTSLLSIGFVPTIPPVVTSPCLSPEVTSTTVNSPISNSPCYSPVTPIHSPASATAAWNHIEQLITSLADHGLKPDQIQNLMELCKAKSTFLLQMYSSAGHDMDTFRVQLLDMPSAYPSLL